MSGSGSALAQELGWTEEKLASTIKQRNAVAREVLTTETYYIDCLKHLFKEDVGKIFSNLETIIRLNEVFLQEIKERVDSWSDEQKLGDVFVRMAPLFSLYSPYCNNYSLALQTVAHHAERAEVDTFLKEAMRADPRFSLQLTALLIMPVQRVMRYQLLLNELIKHTWPSHPDYALLQQALEKIRGTVDEMNEGVRVAENEYKLYAIQSSFFSTQKSSIPTIVKPGRWFIHEGVLQKIAPRIVQTRTVFLFNDVAVTASRILNTQLFQVGKVLPLGPSWLRDLADTAELQNAFQLVTPKRTYLFFSKTAEEKATWLRVIAQVIDKLVAADPTLIGQRAPARMETVKDSFFSMFSLTSSKMDPVLLQEVPPPRDTSLLSVERARVASPVPPLYPSAAAGGVAPAAAGSSAGMATAPPLGQPLAPPLAGAAHRPTERFSVIRTNVVDGACSPSELLTTRTPSPPPSTEPASSGAAAVADAAAEASQSRAVVENKLYRILKKSHRMAAGVMQVVHGVEPARGPAPAEPPSMLSGPPPTDAPTTPGTYGAPKPVSREALQSVRLRPISLALAPPALPARPAGPGLMRTVSVPVGATASVSSPPPPPPPPRKVLPVPAAVARTVAPTAAAASTAAGGAAAGGVVDDGGGASVGTADTSPAAVSAGAGAGPAVAAGGGATASPPVKPLPPPRPGSKALPVPGSAAAGASIPPTAAAPAAPVPSPAAPDSPTMRPKPALPTPTSAGAAGSGSGAETVRKPAPPVPAAPPPPPPPPPVRPGSDGGAPAAQPLAVAASPPPPSGTAPGVPARAKPLPLPQPQTLPGTPPSSGVQPVASAVPAVPAKAKPLPAPAVVASGSTPPPPPPPPPPPLPSAPVQPPPATAPPDSGTGTKPVPPKPLPPPKRPV